jgi:hypothetical protein
MTLVRSSFSVCRIIVSSSRVICFICNTNRCQSEHNTNRCQSEHNTNRCQSEHNSNRCQSEHNTNRCQSEHNTNRCQSEHNTNNPDILWKVKAHSTVCHSHCLVPVVIHMNRVHDLPSFFKNTLKLSSHQCLDLSSCLFSFRPAHQIV